MTKKGEKTTMFCIDVESNFTLLYREWYLVACWLEKSQESKSKRAIKNVDKV